MSNKIYDEHYYNKPTKDRFINVIAETYSESTVSSYKRILSRVSVLEERFDKDLYDFSMKEVEQFLIKLNTTSMASATHAVALIDNYIKWCIGERLTKSNINPMDIFTASEIAARVVNKNVKNVFTYTDIQNVIVDTVNFQDSALVLALFYGIMGKEFSELTNLRIEDIDQENFIINLKGKESERQIKLVTEDQKELIDFLIQAHDQREYIKNNGIIGKIKNPRGLLTDNGHVFKPMLRVTRNGDLETVTTTASYFVLRNRLASLADLFDMPSFNAVNIRNSGMLFMAYQEYEDNNHTLTRDSKHKIYEHFNIKKHKYFDDAYHSYAYERDFLNEEMIRELYYEE